MRNFVLALAALGSATIGIAAPFTNGSFESPGFGASTSSFFGVGNDTFVTGWTHTATGSDGSVDFYTRAPFWNINADHLDHYIGFGGSSTTGGILFQTFDTVIGSTYTVNYRLTTQQLAGNVIPLQSTFVQALNGLTVLNSVSNTFNPLAGVWINGTTLSFVAASISSTLRFTDTSNGAVAASVNWGLDNVTVSATAAPGNQIPEPATYSIIGLGLALIAFRHHRK